MLTKPKTLLSKISKKIEFGSCNADNSKIRRFVKLIWEQHHQSTFVTMVEYVSKTAYHLQQIKKTLSS